MYISAGRALALCRIGFGLYMLSQAWDKTMNGWLGDGSRMAGALLGNPNATPPTRGFSANAEPFYRSFLETTMAPNATLFSQLVTIGEWVVAISLIFGLLTRLGAIVGIWLPLNYMLMKGLASNGGSIDRLYTFACIAFILGSAGLVWGLDGTLRQQFGSNPLTRWLAGLGGRGETVPDRERVPV